MKKSKIIFSLIRSFQFLISKIWSPFNTHTHTKKNGVWLNKWKSSKIITPQNSLQITELLEQCHLSVFSHLTLIRRSRLNPINTHISILWVCISTMGRLFSRRTLLKYRTVCKALTHRGKLYRIHIGSVEGQESFTWSSCFKWTDFKAICLALILLQDWGVFTLREFPSITVLNTKKRSHLSAWESLSCDD